MNPHVLREYARLRKLDWSAVQAMRSAKIRDVFTNLEAQDLVRFAVEADDEQYDMSFIDAWDERPSVKKRYKKEIAARLDREGHNCLVTYSRASDDEPWEHADSCGGFVGDDWKDSGTDFDLMLAAIEASDAVCSDVDSPCFGISKDDCEQPDCVVRLVIES